MVRLTDDEITALCEKYKITHRLTIASNGHHYNELKAYEHGLRTTRVFRSISVPLIVGLEPKYRHEKTGGIYTFVSNGLVQIDGTWMDSVNYKDDKGNPFTRTFIDFHSKFTLIP